MALTFEQAIEGQECYRATNPDTLRKLGSVTLVAFSGATGVGKNYNIDQLGFPEAGTITTRSSREGDNDHRYITLDEMLERIKNGTLVQYGAIRETGTIYGSDADDYSEEGINVMDVVIRSVDTLFDQGFKKVLPIGLVTYARDWEDRLNRRFKGMDKSQIKGRLDEAEASTLALVDEWSDRTDRLLIVSADIFEAWNKDAINKFIEQGSVENTDNNIAAAKIGRGMLDSIPHLRKKFLGES